MHRHFFSRRGLGLRSGYPTCQLCKQAEGTLHNRCYECPAVQAYRGTRTSQELRQAAADGLDMRHFRERFVAACFPCPSHILLEDPRRNVSPVLWTTVSPVACLIKMFTDGASHATRWLGCGGNRRRGRLDVGSLQAGGGGFVASRDAEDYAVATVGTLGFDPVTLHIDFCGTVVERVEWREGFAFRARRHSRLAVNVPHPKQDSDLPRGIHSRQCQWVTDTRQK